MKDMDKLAEKGRNGDTRVAHLTEGEVVIPKEIAELRPDLVMHVAEQLRRMGGDPGEIVVGQGRINPETGIEEFATEEEVRAAYQQVLGRAPESQEALNYWMGQDNLSSFAKAAQPELVNRAYDQILGRQADEAGFNYWTSKDSFDPGVFALAAQPEIAGQRQAMRQSLTDLQGRFQPMADQYGAMQEQLAMLQQQYEMLLKEQQQKGGSSGGIVGGVGVVDDGSSLNSGGGMGTTGVVYGPDGTPYSSAAAAIAAGVTNFTFVKPVVPQTPAGPGLISGADNLTGIPPGVSGNVNPGALIAGQNQQLFTRPTGAQMPPNPFAV